MMALVQIVGLCICVTGATILGHVMFAAGRDANRWLLSAAMILAGALFGALVGKIQRMALTPRRPRPRHRHDD